MVADSSDSVFRLRAPEVSRVEQIGHCVVEEKFGKNGTSWVSVKVSKPKII
jgi:hypothetical protein